MSNLFNKNNRFDVLNEEVNKNKQKKDSNQNKFKSNNDNTNFVTNQKESKIKNSIFKREYEIKKREDEIKKREELRKSDEAEQSLNINNFPELKINKKDFNKTQSVIQNTELNKNYLTKLKTLNMVDNIKETDEVEPGWVRIQFERKYIDSKKKTIYKFDYGKSSYIESNSTSNDVLKELVNIHQKRNKFYIEMLGEYEYSKVFKFPNYDYNYYDKLDEKYEEYEYELKELEENMSDDEYDDYY